MGSRTERLLLETIEALDGFAGLRVDFGGGAGFKSPHDAGDIIVGRPDDAFPESINPEDEQGIKTYSDLYIVEEKYKSTDANKYLQEKGEKFDAMINFALAIGATPVLAVRWSSNLEWSPGPHHLLRDAREVRRTKAGNVSVKPETAKTKYQKVDEFFDI